MKFLNKKFLGIKISSYLQAFVCLIVAFCIWLFANYYTMDTTPPAEDTASISEGLN